MTSTNWKKEDVFEKSACLCVGSRQNSYQIKDTEVLIPQELLMLKRGDRLNIDGLGLLVVDFVRSEEYEWTAKTGGKYSYEELMIMTHRV